MLQKCMCAGPAATGTRCSTQIVTCSNLCLGSHSREANPVTSIEQGDVQSVLAAIDDLLPLISKRAQATEDLRRLPDETVAELDEVGFFKLLQPEQWGGLQCDPTVFYEAGRRIATACGASGWGRSIIGAHHWRPAGRPAGSAPSAACTTGTWRYSTSRPSKRCGATTPPCESHRRTRRWVRA